MSTLPLSSRPTRRKSHINIITATLFRHRGDTQWRLSVIYGGKRSVFTDTNLTNETAAREFAILKVRELTRPRAQSPEPRAQSPEPRAQSPEPRAQSPEPRAQSPEPRADPTQPSAMKLSLLIPLFFVSTRTWKTLPFISGTMAMPIVQPRDTAHLRNVLCCHGAN